jgi:hypothetical protein
MISSADPAIRNADPLIALVVASIVVTVLRRTVALLIMALAPAIGVTPFMSRE